MYAIVEINGQQFKAEQGKKLFVNHIKDAKEGQAVEFDKVLLVDKDGSVQVGAPTVDGAKVVCEVVNPLVKGDKVALIGFGTFGVTEKAARTGINPATKQKITIAAKKVVKFKAGAELADKVK